MGVGFWAVFSYVLEWIRNLGRASFNFNGRSWAGNASHTMSGSLAYVQKQVNSWSRGVHRREPGVPS